MHVVTWTNLERETIAEVIQFAAEQLEEQAAEGEEIHDPTPWLKDLAKKLEDRTLLEFTPLDCGLIWNYYEEFGGYLADAGRDVEYDAGLRVVRQIKAAELEPKKEST
jgi:hypothetical protein